MIAAQDTHLTATVLHGLNFPVRRRQVVDVRRIRQNRTTTERTTSVTAARLVGWSPKQMTGHASCPLHHSAITAAAAASATWLLRVTASRPWTAIATSAAANSIYEWDLIAYLERYTDMKIFGDVLDSWRSNDCWLDFSNFTVNYWELILNMHHLLLFLSVK